MLAFFFFCLLASWSLGVCSPLSCLLTELAQSDVHSGPIQLCLAVLSLTSTVNPLSGAIPRRIMSSSFFFFSLNFLNILAYANSSKSQVNVCVCVSVWGAGTVFKWVHTHVPEDRSVCRSQRLARDVSHWPGTHKIGEARPAGQQAPEICLALSWPHWIVYIRHQIRFIYLSFGG